MPAGRNESDAHPKSCGRHPDRQSDATSIVYYVMRTLKFEASHPDSLNRPEVVSQASVICHHHHCQAGSHHYRQGGGRYQCQAGSRHHCQASGRHHCQAYATLQDDCDIDLQHGNTCIIPGDNIKHMHAPTDDRHSGSMFDSASCAMHTTAMSNKCSCTVTLADCTQAHASAHAYRQFGRQT